MKYLLYVLTVLFLAFSACSKEPTAHEKKIAQDKCIYDMLLEEEPEIE
jgi:hypothetical protein